MRDDAVLRRALPLGRGLGQYDDGIYGNKHSCSVGLRIIRLGKREFYNGHESCTYTTTMVTIINKHVSI